MQRSEADEMAIRGAIVTITEAMKVVGQIMVSTNAEVGPADQPEARLKMARLFVQLEELHMAMVAAAKSEGVEI